MKFKTTQKAIRNNYCEQDCLRVGYCDAWHLLKWTEPNAYCSGVYGWNCDFYFINDRCISTGYRGMMGKQAKFTREFEEKARAIYNDWNIEHGAKLEQIRALCLEWLEKEFNN